jgi:methionyl-tRNA formyltransferase
MKIIFAGTPDFAVPALQALIDAGHQVSMVLTQPDRPSGRGMKLKPSPVKQLAVAHGIEVFQPETLRDAPVQAPRYGCYNIHASLLPRWRGAAPIQRALLAGDSETGVTIMEVVPALDAGAMVSRGVLPITERDTAQTLHDGLADIGARLMVEAMRQLERDGKLPATPQDESLVTYAHKLDKAEAAIDWQRPADELSRQVRAFNPFPVAQTRLNGEVCRIWMATSLPGGAEAGRIVDTADGIVVGCGEGLLRIEELQMPGGKRLAARDFLQGHALQAGQVFGQRAPEGC